MKSLCWKKNVDGESCKNYNIIGKTTCRHHVKNSKNFKYNLAYMLTCCFIIYVASTYNQELSYMTINSLCKSINKVGYNICLYIENYRTIYKEIFLI